ncbi:hypothetical protein SprV_0602117000 [Sparganum proliferum]
MKRRLGRCIRSRRKGSATFISAVFDGWQDRIPDTGVQERTGILSIYAILRQLQLRWSGHLLRMDDEGLPKRLFYTDVGMGSSRQGGQVRRHKDILKASLKRLSINPANWEDLARDRPTWRRTVKTGATIYEAHCIAAAKTKREISIAPASPHQCSTAPSLPTMSADLPGINRPHWTSSY